MTEWEMNEFESGVVEKLDTISAILMYIAGMTATDNQDEKVLLMDLLNDTIIKLKEKKHYD